MPRTEKDGAADSQGASGSPSLHSVHDQHKQQMLTRSPAEGATESCSLWNFVFIPLFMQQMLDCTRKKIVDESFSRFLSNGEINSLAYVLKPRLEFSDQKMSVA